MNDSREVLARAVSGDETAWKEIVHRYQRLVYANVRAFRIQADDAEDIFQEAFLRLYRHATRIEDASALAQWLTVTTRRLCLDHLSRERAALRTAMSAESPTSPEGPIESLIRHERAREIQAALEELPERCRELLGLLYFAPESPDYSEISRRLGIPVGSIGPTRARCLDRLLRRMRLHLSRAGEEKDRIS